MSSTSRIIAALALGAAGAAFAQGNPPTTAPANPATAAGQQSPSGGPMGTTGVTPQSGGASGTTAPAAQAPTDTSRSTGTTMAASGDTPAVRRARADRN
ncbi:proteophosphoglycan ppg4 [Variovorax paradoxus]|nr:proteophosphoglycan ppg4 [Variovorax paradoxus]